MTDTCYKMQPMRMSRYVPPDGIKQEELAEVRTRMANKRTFLAYIRTALSVAAIAKSYDDNIFGIIGIVFVCVALLDYFYTDITIQNPIKGACWDAFGKQAVNIFQLIYPVLVAIVSFYVLGLHVHN